MASAAGRTSAPDKGATATAKSLSAGKSLTVLADRYHYRLSEHLHPEIRLITYDAPTGWTDSQIRQADALLVRTTNSAGPRTIPDSSRLRFVGTASAGRDHLDEEWLASSGIVAADAKGSNARAVAEYVAAGLLLLLEKQGQLERDGFRQTLTAGIIGAGCTGKVTAELLSGIGISCLLHDPPRQEREPDTFRSAALDDVLSCDILSLHVPLTDEGPHATRHWLDRHKTGRRPGQIIINASRGGVADENVLTKATDDGRISAYLCDVWEHEPCFRDKTVEKAFLATPHIAGYSLEAKLEATRMICRQLHRFFDLPDPRQPEMRPNVPTVPDTFRSMSEVLKTIHPATKYEKGLRKLIGLPDPEKRAGFLSLRQLLPLRHEFANLRLPGRIRERFPLLEKLGLAFSDGTG